MSSGPPRFANYTQIAKDAHLKMRLNPENVSKHPDVDESKLWVKLAGGTSG